MLELSFETEIIHWRGPSPFFFAPLPAKPAEEVQRLFRIVTYGWGMIPVEVAVGEVVFRTAMFRKDGTYFLPLKDAVRRKASLTAGNRVAVEMTLLEPKR